jgi:2-polyprenyl-3-methyl-5-hydroxy-6-metoxy-1,4-benzoquinol methylase
VLNIMNSFQTMNNIPPYVSLLVNTILHKLPFHTQGLKNTLALLDFEELRQLEDYLVSSLSHGLSIEYLAESYRTIMLDVLRETVYFQEHKKYRYSAFSEVANSVYYNSTYMSLYMHGLLISLFFWPNHLTLYRFFRKTLPKSRKGTYLEVGPGHGYFFLTAVEHSAYDQFMGIDLSETSIHQTNNLVGRNHPEKELQLQCIDFLTCSLDEASFDAIVMGEMLEHVANPQDFLTKIASIAKKDAYIYVSTCINAPALDHIYLFQNEEQVEDLFSQCGLHIKKQCILPYVGKTLAECREQFLAINVGYVLEKK